MPYLNQPWWWEHGRCAGLDEELFFPKDNQPKLIRAAKVTCKRCPVRSLCLEWAIETDSEGIFGGTTKPERDLIAPILRASGVLNGRSQISVGSTLLDAHHTSFPSPLSGIPKFELRPPAPKFVLVVTQSR